MILLIFSTLFSLFFEIGVFSFNGRVFSLDFIKFTSLLAVHVRYKFSHRYQPVLPIQS